MTLNRYNPRRDPNEAETVALLEAAGCVVWRLSQAGIPDLLCGYRGRWFLIECKGEGGRLKPSQQLFLDTAHAAGLPVFVLFEGEPISPILDRVVKAQTGWPSSDSAQNKRAGSRSRSPRR